MEPIESESLCDDLEDQLEDEALCTELEEESAQ
jgi:hypothetical protein